MRGGPIAPFTLSGLPPKSGRPGPPLQFPLLHPGPLCGPCREKEPSWLTRGPFGGRMSSAYSDGRFLLRSGGLDEPDGMIASSGMGMPLSAGNNGAGGGGGELYGR
jgi:hypothetical protein